MSKRRALDALCRTDFIAFSQMAYREKSGGRLYDMNWHIEAIAHQLDCTRRGDQPRLVVTLPPRSLKSFLISVAWVAWLLGQDPSLKLIVVSYSAELSAQFAHECRKIMRSAWYMDLFPGTRLAPDRQAVMDFQTTAGGGRLSTSIGGALTGRGGDYIIIDDPIKAGDAQSETVRRTTIEWIINTLFSRLDEKRVGRILLVMQRLHEGDLAGYLIERGWPELRLAAIAPEDETAVLSPTRVHHRAKDEVLHQEREPIETLLDIKSEMSSSHFQAQYQQEPAPAEGNMIKAEWLRYYREAPPLRSSDRILQSWDTASEDNLASDYSVCITALQRGRHLYILDVYRARVGFPDLCRKVLELQRTWNAEILLIEKAASGRQLIQYLLEDFHPFAVVPIKPKDTKQVRMDGQTVRIEIGELFLPEDAHWLGAFKHEILAFPHSRRDDQVDALSQLLNYTRFSIYDGPDVPPEVGNPRAPFIEYEPIIKDEAVERDEFDPEWRYVDDDDDF